jgi:U3 small nucleolar RNA-associated protein 12
MNEHTLKMNENVLAIACSPDSRFIAISLLDSTVKVFFLDSLKFYLSLYGHKLPVNSIDISSDGTLIITASADKNVKIWGLDFGDCHRSILAHQESITSVQFLKNTHYFCSVSKDGGVKLWDADNFKCFQEIRDKSLHSPLSNVVLSYEGDKLIAAGHERALLIYHQTEDLFFLEEEEERKLEADYEKELVESQQFLNLQDPNSESTFAGKRTIETITSGDKLIEAIEYAMKDDELFEEYNKNPQMLEPPVHNPLFMGVTSDEYIWKHLTKVKKSEIENVLSIIPFKDGQYILKKMENIIKTLPGVSIEFSSKIVISICEIFQHQILSDPSMTPLIGSLSKMIKSSVSKERVF